MSLSDQEHRLLAEIEQNLRRDPAFARRIDALNAAPLRDGPQRYACHVSGREIICILLLVIVLAVVLVCVTLAAGTRTSTPSELPVRAPATTSSSHRDVPGRPQGMEQGMDKWHVAAHRMGIWLDRVTISTSPPAPPHQAKRARSGRCQEPEGRRPEAGPGPG